MTSRATTPRRVALVTGGTGGIGGGVVTALTQRGFDVVVSDRAMDPADALKARAAADARLAFVTGDVADLTDHPRFVDAAFAAFGRVDSLVNNAGVSVTSRGDRLDVSVDSYDLNFAVNTRGAFFLTQTVCRRMLEAEPHGAESARSIIFVSSSNAAIAAPERGGLAPHGIVVDEVRPGLIKTPMTGVAQERFDTRLAEGFTPLNRWGTPEDIGRAVATLATGDLPFPTGAAIPVDGGMHLHSY
jgi:3-oxoacyl-[acyl-carrier protein] reductase